MADKNYTLPSLKSGRQGSNWRSNDDQVRRDGRSATASLAERTRYVQLFYLPVFISKSLPLCYLSFKPFNCIYTLISDTSPHSLIYIELLRYIDLLKFPPLEINRTYNLAWFYADYLPLLMIYVKLLCWFYDVGKILKILNL